MMRIAVGGIGHESNTFLPLLTGTKEFFVRRGEETVTGNVFDEFRAKGVEFVGTLRASAIPHGIVERAVYDSLKAELLERLTAALPVDGVFLSLHGAMEVEGIGDGESDFTADVRRVVGTDVPISVSLDLHGNIAPAFVEASDMMTALRTAPHRDGEPTARRALTHLVRAIETGVRPFTVMVKVPIFLPGEFAVTEVEPAKSLYARLAEIESVPGIWDASLMIGCAWTDSPHTSVAVLVVAERDRELALGEASRLASEIWGRRDEFGVDVETASVDEAISRALSAPESTVFISDSGDNVTAGGAGDIPLFVERLLAAGARNAVVGGIADPEAVARCVEAGTGSRVSLSIGGKLDTVHGKPLAVTGTVKSLHPAESPKLAVLQVEGVEVILATDRRPFANFAAFEEAGIDPLERKIVVVKLGYLFPQLRDNAPRAIMAYSPGFTDLRLERLPFQRIRRPIFPLDRDFSWEPD